MQWMVERKHSLSVEHPADEPLTVVGDETRITQIVQNLLHNAAKYTPHGGKILLGARRESAEVVISVKDNGVGMDAELLESAFNLFKQGQQPLHRPHGGLGVGLTLVHRLVRMHGGTVQAFSAGANQGSEFIVRLPAADAAASTAAPAVQTEPSRALVTPRRVLVIDDNNDAATALRLLLENDGHEVRVAHDGVSGLGASRANTGPTTFFSTSACRASAATRSRRACGAIPA